MYKRITDENAQRLIEGRRARKSGRRHSRFTRFAHSSFDHFARCCRNGRAKCRKFSSKVVEIGKAQWQAWIRIVILHILPVLAALWIVAFNIKGYFIGKQLTGQINQDGTKMLALQLTAKLHELLMLASLADILCSYLLHLVVFGDGAPLGALTAGQNFSSISYLWSKDFYAVCRAAFSHKAVLLCLMIVCTILGVVVGPSSATAMAPREDVWSVNKLQLPLNVSKEELWPSILNQTTLPKPLCSNQSQDCRTDGVWPSLSTNLFAYWGMATYGRVQGMPEATDISGADAMRTFHVRFRGPLSMYQPDFTVATVQPVFAANIVNGLRMVWFSDNARRCSEGEGGYCDYQDLKWSIDTMQPTVYVACALADATGGLGFPTMSRVNGTDVLSKVSVALPASTNASGIAVDAIQLDGDQFSDVSIGAILRVPRDDQSVVYACSVDAQWSSSTVATTFLGSPFMVDGSPPYFFTPVSEGSTYQGRRVQIAKSWAETVLSSIDTATNLTIIDRLYASGDDLGAESAGEKLESILSVLVAENMARVNSEVELDLGDRAESLAALQWSELQGLKARSSDTQVVDFRTRVTGYGYGVWTDDSIAVGVLLSVMILIMYCVIVLVHFVVRFIQGGHVVHSWRKMIELLVLALRSPIADSMLDDSSDAMLRENVRFVQQGNHVEMAFGQTSKKKAAA